MDLREGSKPEGPRHGGAQRSCGPVHESPARRERARHRSAPLHSQKYSRAAGRLLSIEVIRRSITLLEKYSLLFVCIDYKGAEAVRLGRGLFAAYSGKTNVRCRYSPDSSACANRWRDMTSEIR